MQEKEIKMDGKKKKKLKQENKSVNHYFKKHEKNEKDKNDP